MPDAPTLPSPGEVLRTPEDAQRNVDSGYNEPQPLTSRAPRETTAVFSNEPSGTYENNGVVSFRSNRTPIPTPSSVAPVTQFNDNNSTNTPTPVLNSSEDLVVDKNAEYKRRVAALGDNPTQQQMDEVKNFGLSEWAKHHPQLTK